MLKGYLCTIETSCIHSLDTVETVFVPSRNLEAVKTWCGYYGTLLMYKKHEIDIETVSNEQFEILEGREDAIETIKKGEQMRFKLLRWGYVND